MEIGISDVLSYISPFAASFCGGFVCFLYGVATNQHKKDKKLIKFLIDAAGGGLTGLFLGPLVTYWIPHLAECPKNTAHFLTGVSWCIVIQVTRGLITLYAESQIKKAKGKK